MEANCEVENCEESVSARNLCRKHYTRWYRHGDPLAVTERRDPADRYREKFDKRGPDDCWEWKAGTSKGYGRLRLEIDGEWKFVQAHRFGWELHNGPIEDNTIFVCHKCDNRLCQNPAHLFLGTCEENLADMRAKGRGSDPPRNDHHGESGPGAKLTEKQVRKIRRLYEKGWRQRDLAERFGVEQTNISAIVRRKSWTHI